MSGAGGSGGPGRRPGYFDYPEFPLRPPPAPGDRGRRVVIVGAGPIGLAAALELARHGVASTVLDPKGSVCSGSRAICLARHTLEGLQQLGLAERFTAKALGWTRGTSFYRERPVYRLTMPHSEDERFLPMYNLQQQYTELFMAEQAMAEPLIDLRWQSRAVDVAAELGGVTVAVSTAAGDFTLSADYLLACDGARSDVRGALGLSLAGEAYEGRYVIADIHLPSDLPTERRAYFDARANPGATVLVHRQPDDIWRIDYQLADDADADAALEEAAVRERIRAVLAMLGEHGPWTLEWRSLYRAYTLCLDDYRHGRVFFLGDAAHLVPIFGVRGLNSGFADAMNLGWKLAWVLRGCADPALLDSYSPERRGATLDIFAAAGKSTRFMAPPTRGYRRVRDAALALAAEHECARRLLDPRQSQPYSYAASPLTSACTIGCADPDLPAPGAPLANARLEQGYLLDRLGPGFTLVTVSEAGEPPAGTAALIDAASRGGTPLGHVALARHAGAAGGNRLRGERYSGNGDRWLLVRPDRHVCARGTGLDVGAAGGALQRALGRTRVA